MHDNILLVRLACVYVAGQIYDNIKAGGIPLHTRAGTESLGNVTDRQNSPN